MLHTGGTKILLVDHHDSFTYNLRDYLLQTGAECICISEDDLTIQGITDLAPAGIVFSPGPEKPIDHPLMFDILRRFHQGIPILGICLGFQAIGSFYGANITHAPRPMHGKVSTVTHNGHAIFRSVPDQFRAARYHSLQLENLESTPLEVIASTRNGTPMGAAHPHHPVTGLQFHPEAILTEFGIQIIRNWTEFLNIF